MIAGYPLTISAAGRSLLAKKEGNYNQVYDDASKADDKRVSSYAEVKGYPTIGIGHRIKEKEKNAYSHFFKGKSQLSEAQIQSLLSADILEAETLLRERVQAPVTQAMVDAIIIQTFNTGPWTQTAQKVARLINEGKYEEAHKSMYEAPKTTHGNPSKPLEKRRLFERDLFGSQGYPDSIYSSTGGGDTGTGIDTGYSDTGYLVPSAFATMPRWVIPMLVASSCCMGLLAAFRIRRNLKSMNS